jgi:hypothetical protein
MLVYNAAYAKRPLQSWPGKLLREGQRATCAKLRLQNDRSYIAHMMGDVVSWGTIREWVRDIEIDQRAAYLHAMTAAMSARQPTSKSAVRKRLITERGWRCEECLLESWLGKPITLEVDHINGDKKDNDNKNLKLLCPNCHSQTPTWRRQKPARVA